MLDFEKSTIAKDRGSINENIEMNKWTYKKKNKIYNDCIWEKVGVAFIEEKIIKTQL